MKHNIHSGVGAGKYRRPWRIREYLDSINYSMAAVARDVDRSATLVRETVQGNKNNRPVLRRLVELGCPIEDLSLPEDMRA
jgi:hypothetical protein